MPRYEDMLRVREQEWVYDDLEQRVLLEGKERDALADAVGAAREQPHVPPDNTFDDTHCYDAEFATNCPLCAALARLDSLVVEGR